MPRTAGLREAVEHAGDAEVRAQPSSRLATATQKGSPNDTPACVTAQFELDVERAGGLAAALGAPPTPFESEYRLSSRFCFFGDQNALLPSLATKRVWISALPTGWPIRVTATWGSSWRGESARPPSWRRMGTWSESLRSVAPQIHRLLRQKLRDGPPARTHGTPRPSAPRRHPIRARGCDEFCRTHRQLARPRNHTRLQSPTQDSRMSGDTRLEAHAAAWHST